MPGAGRITLEQAAAAMALSDMGHSTRQIENEIGVTQASVSDILNRKGRWAEVLDSSIFQKLRSQQNKALELASRTMAAQLFMRGVESFFPKLSLTKSPLRKTQRVSLFPNYLFVRFQNFENEYGSVAWCPGVSA